MKATLLTIGDELLIGQVVNTNAAWLGTELNLLGVEVTCSVVVGDDEAAIVDALAAAFDRSDLVVTTGGLGPTHDDLTREALATFFAAPLVLHPPSLERIEQRFAHRGRPMPARNRQQAMVPEGFSVLTNPIGTAPGLWHRFERDGGVRMLAVLPGVPAEMKRLLREAVVPRLQAEDGLGVVVHRTLRTTGIGESNLQEVLGDLDGWLGDGRSLAYLPSPGGVRLRMTVVDTDRDAAQARLEALEAVLRERAGRYVYGTGEEELEAALGRMLASAGLTLALAESCTGGHALDLLTDVPGSSRYLRGGVVAYCNSVKEQVLGVAPEALATHGAVSEEVALQMARGARERLGADVGLATTGVAGPGGGSDEKPVGTVWVAYADAEAARAVTLRFTSDRLLNKALFTTAVFDLLRRQLLRRGVAPDAGRAAD